MSKSLGNFIDLEKIDHYVESFGLDALRYFLATQGPIGTVDSDFTEARFIEVYQTDLANAVGNCLSRIVNTERLGGSGAGNAPLELDRIAKGVELVRRIDAYIEATQPFKLAKQAGRKREVAAILYECAETFRIASLWLWPAMPGKMEEVWRRLCLGEYGDTLRERGRGRLEAWCGWGGLPAGTQLDKGPPLFPRYDPA
jgi:methionyl-tRNA synthetase